VKNFFVFSSSLARKKTLALSALSNNGQAEWFLFNFTWKTEEF
jgi:hypothetical protein